MRKNITLGLLFSLVLSSAPLHADNALLASGIRLLLSHGLVLSGSAAGGKLGEESREKAEVVEHQATDLSLRAAARDKKKDWKVASEANWAGVALGSLGFVISAFCGFKRMGGDTGGYIFIPFAIAEFFLGVGELIAGVVAVYKYDYNRDELNNSHDPLADVNSAAQAAYNKSDEALKASITALAGAVGVILSIAFTCYNN